MIRLVNYIMPIMVIIIIIYSLKKKRPIYDDFLEGVKEGLQISLNIFPSIFAMIVSVSIFLKSNILTDILKYINIKFIPKELFPLAILRPISGSSSLMILNNILKVYGPDSKIGLIAAIIAASTDTTIYIIGTYFGSIKIKKIKYALIVGLLADLTCIILSILIIN